MENFILSGDFKSVFPKESFGKIILDCIRKHDPNKVAMVDGVTGEEITNQQLLDRSIKMAIALQKLGIGKDDVVAVISENCINYFIPILSCYYIGAIVNTINNTYKKLELINVFKISQPKLLFCAEALIQDIKAVSSHFDCIKYLVSFGEGSNDIYSFEDMLQMGDENIEDFKTTDVDPEQQVCTVLCSSGTTGLPKGVMITHNSLRLVMNYTTEKEYLSMTSADSTIGMMPFYHTFGLVVSLGSIINGMKEVIFAKFKPDLFLKAIQEHKITKLYVVPSLAVFLAKSPMVDNYDLSSVNDIMCAAASLGPEIQQIIENKMKVHIRQGYGLTETGGIVTISKRYSDRDCKHGCSGSIVSNVDIKVVDIESRKPLAANNIGEICIKSEMTMKGYMNNEQATREAFDEDGFMRTGDIGYYDEDGSFFIVERLKELIKYKGFQVPPAEIEDILISHPSIKEAGVIGVPDEKCGELPLAFIVKQQGCEVSEEEIIKYVADHLSLPKQLHGGVNFIEELPKSQTGKVLRRKLKELLV